MGGEGQRQLVFLSAAEPSADAHCAGLVTALRRRMPGVQCVGLGGPRMAAAGCAQIEGIDSSVDRAAMGYNAFSHVLHYVGLIRRIKAFLGAYRPKLVVVCDSPAFNFHVAASARKLGIKTLFYVAPQLWAWAPWRIAKLRKNCDKLCCILPFEQEWFAARGIQAEFVGNPLFDGLTPADIARGRRSFKDFDAKAARIAIMPGSRQAEVRALWRPMQQIAIALRRRYPNATFTTAAVDVATKEAMDSTRLVGFRTRYAIDAVYQTARDSDLAIVASGSATLQVAAAGCPMVIMYKISRVLWHLVGRWLVRTKHLSLVNILAGRELVPEFMPYVKSTDQVIETAQGLLADKAKLAEMSTELVGLTQPLAAKKAGEEVARVIAEMIG